MKHVTFKPQINREAPKKSIDLSLVNKKYIPIQN